MVTKISIEDLKKKGYVFQDIKTEKITEKQLEELKKMAGSYEVISLLSMSKPNIKLLLVTKKLSIL